MVSGFSGIDLIDYRAYSCQSLNLLIESGNFTYDAPVHFVMSAICWQLEHSVDVAVTAEFVWNYRTNIETWNDPPAKFVLNGPFAEGACGSTLLPNQEPLHWRIRDVRPPTSYVVEMYLDGASLCFEWYFDALTEHLT